MCFVKNIYVDFIKKMIKILINKQYIIYANTSIFRYSFGTVK